MAIYRRERSTRLLVIGLVMVSLVTITVDFRGGEKGPLASLGRAALTVITPLQEAVSNVFRPIGSFFTDLGRLSSLKEENAELQAQLEDFAAERTRQLTLERKLAEAEQLLGLRERLAFAPGETIGATMIAGPFTNLEWTVVIDRGSADGIKVDMPVMAGGGLVGRVSRVAPGSSKVLLISDPDSAVSARLASTGETGIVHGQRENELRLGLVDAETQVDPREQVLTSGLGGIFPEGIPIGGVSQVVLDEDNLTKDVLVRPYVDFSRLGDVLVIRARPRPAFQN